MTSQTGSTLVMLLRFGSEAVFLDSWVVPNWMEGQTLASLRREMATTYEDDGELWSALYNSVQPAYILYCVGADGQRENVSMAHQTPARGDDGEYLGRVPSLQEMLPAKLRAVFSSTVCGGGAPKQHMVQVSPQGGTLVVFDSAVVPHEVTKVVNGERLALFGFFAEER